MFSCTSNRSSTTTSDHLDDREMHEFIPCFNSENNLHTIHPSNLSNSDQATSYNQSLSVSRDHSTISHSYSASIHRTFSHLKNKIKPSRHEHVDESGRNDDYLVVADSDSDLLVLRQDILDRQQTRDGQSCVQINDAPFDLNQIQYTSPTPTRPNLSPSQPPVLGLSRMLTANQLDNQFEFRSTRSTVECEAPQADLLNNHDAQISRATKTSPSSTNSSDHRYIGTDRSLLDDAAYVEAQKLDLERLTMIEMAVFDERRYLRTELNMELKYKDSYEQALKTNLHLQDELKKLQEEHNLIDLPWSCKLCTLENERYSDTRRDICSGCESPSPLKEVRLTK